jgi:hypothetical protein
MPEPLLGNGSINAFPLLGNRSLIMQQWDFNNEITMFSMWPVPRGYKRDEILELKSVDSQFCMKFEHGSRGRAIVGAVTRKRLITE